MVPTNKKFSIKIVSEEEVIDMKKLKVNEVFTLCDEIFSKNGQVASKNILDGKVSMNLFSYSKGESISEEMMYKNHIYICLDGSGEFFSNGKKSLIKKDELIFFKKGMPFSSNTREGMKLLEISFEEEKMENIKNLESGKVFDLKEKIDYAEGQVISMDLVKNDDVVICLFAFDEGEGLPTHSAPGDALVQILEGEAKITVNETEHDLKAGESIVFESGDAHSLKADMRFKMLLTIIK